MIDLMSLIGTKLTCHPLQRMSANEVLNGLGADIASSQLMTPTGRCAPQGGNCVILRQTRWDGSMKRRTLKWHLPLLVLSVLVSCDCTRI